MAERKPDDGPWVWESDLFILRVLEIKPAENGLNEGGDFMILGTWNL